MGALLSQQSVALAPGAWCPQGASGLCSGSVSKRWVTESVLLVSRPTGLEGQQVQKEVGPSPLPPTEG